MIIKNTLGFLLITAALMQLSWAKPKPLYSTSNTSLLESEDLCHQEADDDVEVSETDPSLKLHKLVSQDFKDLSLKYTKKAKIISEQLLKDKEISDSKSPRILEFKQNLTQYQENYSLCEGIKALYELAELYSNITSFYFEFDVASIHDEDTKLILTLLRKYGSENLEKENRVLVNAIADKLNKKFDDLKPELEKEPNELAKEILEWGNIWQLIINSTSTSDYEDIVEAFENFFVIFEDEEEE